MIDSKAKLRDCLEREKKIYYPDGGRWLPFGIREKDVLFGYIKLLRKTEYYRNTSKRIPAVLYEARLRRASNLYAIHISANTCEPGLSIAHVGPIIIHGESHIGKNARIHVGVNIGANGGRPPRIGDEVYIGPGAKVFGDIEIADGCKIGANAVVNKSCLDRYCTLVGVPARIIKTQGAE